MTPAITRMAHTVDSSPVANPDRIVVAGPVSEDSAISFTGFRLVDVKCSVSSWITEARIRPKSKARQALLAIASFIHRPDP